MKTESKKLLAENATGFVAGLAIVVFFWMVSPTIKAADIGAHNYARIVPGVSMPDAVAILGMEAQVRVLSADVIELTWFSRDYRECIRVVFVGGKALTKTRARITNEPPMDQTPPNVGE